LHHLEKIQNIYKSARILKKYQNIEENIEKYGEIFGKYVILGKIFYFDEKWQNMWEKIFIFFHIFFRSLVIRYPRIPNECVETLMTNDKKFSKDFELQ